MVEVFRRRSGEEAEGLPLPISKSTSYCEEVAESLHQLACHHERRGSGLLLAARAGG